MSWLTAIQPGDSQTPGVPVLPRKRPGIQTTVYRTDPGTREFVFGEGLDAPGAGMKLQDRLDYNQQMMDAIQGAGGNFQNSPQLASMASQNESGWKALNEQMGAQAQMAGAHAQESMAGAHQAEVDALTNPQVVKNKLLVELAGKGMATQSDLANVGVGVNPQALGAEMGLDKATGLSDAIAKLSVQGKLPLATGSPLHQALATQYGPELAARQAGQPAHWYEHTLGTPGLNVGDALQLGLPAAIRWASGAPSWKQQGEQQVAGLLGQAPAARPAQSLPPTMARPTPGIRVPEKTARKPGVSVYTGSPRVEVRNDSLDRIRRGQP